ncbi:hypothetical protein ULF88_19380 [Halopseudomonas pachastrellae]|nr:hypothetical protein [Halopseudomonas pachastrellae]
MKFARSLPLRGLNRQRLIDQHLKQGFEALLRRIAALLAQVELTLQTADKGIKEAHKTAWISAFLEPKW